MTGPVGIWLTYGAFGAPSWAGFSAFAESSAYCCLAQRVIAEAGRG
jgi:hypothetical protein